MDQVQLKNQVICWVVAHRLVAISSEEIQHQLKLQLISLEVWIRFSNQLLFNSNNNQTFNLNLTISYLDLVVNKMLVNQFRLNNHCLLSWLFKDLELLNLDKLG